jgi:hypothetical protein
MISKFAPPFWLCWTAGMIAGLDTQRFVLGVVLGAVAGVIVGLLFVAAAKRTQRRAFRVPLAGVQAAQATPAADANLPRAA